MDRLPAQMKAMEAVSHHSIAAIHEKFLVEKVTNQWAAQYERDGKVYRRDVPEIIRWHRAWVFPQKQRDQDGRLDSLASWDLPARVTDTALPGAALDLLWRDELYALCGTLRISMPRRANMGEMCRALRWLSNGKELTRGVCAALRSRSCAEADPEIVERAAA